MAIDGQDRCIDMAGSVNKPAMAFLGISEVALDDIARCIAEKSWAPFVSCSQDTKMPRDSPKWPASGSPR